MIRIQFLKDIVQTYGECSVYWFANKGDFGWILDINPDYCVAYADNDPDKKEFKITYSDYEIVNTSDNPTFTATITYPTITDEMVETCAKAMERRRLSKNDWSDEAFNAWWEGSVKFTDRKLLLDSVRTGLETVLQSPYIVSVS